MQEKSKRSLVFGVVAVVALGSTIASAGFGSRARGKLAEARSRAVAAGRVLERADRLDRGRSSSASLVASKLFDGVADLVEADPGDLKRCERAAEKPSGLAKQVMLGPSICRHASQLPITL